MISELWCSGTSNIDNYENKNNPWNIHRLASLGDEKKKGKLWMKQRQGEIMVLYLRPVKIVQYYPEDHLHNHWLWKSLQHLCKETERTGKMMIGWQCHFTGNCTNEIKFDHVS